MLKHPLVQPERDLAKMICFTDADLKANREGYMTKEQRSRLGNERKRALKTASVLIAFAGVVSLAVVCSGGGFGNALLIIAAIMVGVALLLGLLWLKWGQLNNDLHKGSVNIAEGALRLSYRHYEGRYTSRNYDFRLTLGRTQFKIDYPVYRLFEEMFGQDTYCVIYYAPYSRTMLSVESPEFDKLKIGHGSLPENEPY